MQKADALAEIEAIIDDLSPGEIFDDVGEAGYLLLREILEVVRLAVQGRILPSEAHRHVLMDSISLFSSWLIHPIDTSIDGRIGIWIPGFGGCG